MIIRKTIYLFLLLFCIDSSVSGLVTLDFSQEKYNTIITQISNIGYKNIEAVIVRHPFWHLYGKSDKGFGVFYWNTSKDLRAQKNPSAGTISELKELSSFLHSKKIRVYSRIDPFIQIKDFYNLWWDYKDFTIDSIKYGTYNLVSLSGAGKLGPLFRAMKSVPIDKWIIHIDNVPQEMQNQYAGIARKGLGSRLLIYSSFTNKIANYPLIQSEDYWTLRQGPFLTPIAQLSLVSNFQSSRQMHLIDSDSLTINNIATTFYMLSQGLRIVIPSSFTRNSGIAQMLKALQSDNDFKLKLLSEETMLLYSSSQIISFHLGENMNMIKIESLISNTGSFNSVVGNSLLYSEAGYNYFLLFPGSVYLWDIK